MKRLTIGSFAILMLLFTVSCNDMLEESPKSMTVENFYSSPDEIEAGVKAIYTRAMKSRMSGWHLAMIDSQTEWGHGNTDFSTISGSHFIGNFGAFRAMQGLDPVATSNVEHDWNAFYESIRNANLVIKNTTVNGKVSKQQMDRYIAEARFMRAFLYFQLVRCWGGVPIYTEKNMDKTSGVPKSTKEQVYDLITSDLEFAEMYLPDEPPALGRPSKMVAKTFLADVYFFQLRYPEASDKAEEVIQSDKYSLVRITKAEDFNNLFPLNGSSSEEIFYLKFNQQEESRLVLFTMAINTEQYFGSNGYGIFPWRVESKYYAEWDNDDLRKKFNWYVSVSQPVEGYTQLQPKKYSATSSVTTATFDYPIYRYAYVLLLYAEASARKAGAPTVDSMEKLNMVRRRAYGYNPTQSSPVDLKLADYDLESFIDRVIKERGYEFQFEGKRWLDLKRAGKLKEVMKKNIGIDVADKALLWKIPPNEIQLNEAMDPSDQNPGY